MFDTVQEKQKRKYGVTMTSFVTFQRYIYIFITAFLILVTWKLRYLSINPQSSIDLEEIKTMWRKEIISTKSKI